MLIKTLALATAVALVATSALGSPSVPFSPG